MSSSSQFEQINVVVVTSKDGIPVKPREGELLVAYWDIRGLGQPCRISLAYAGVPFTDLRIAPGEHPSDDYKQTWMTKKPELKESLYFPNLPFLFDGREGKKVALVQSRAILRYIGRECDLLGDNIDKFDMMLDEVSDLDAVITRTCYGNVAGAADVITGQVKDKLDDIATYLQTTPFLAGRKVSVADFKLYDTLSKIVLCEKEITKTKVVGSNAVVVDYMDRIASLPAISSYLSSDKFLDRPLNNTHAQFK
jgi:glutathione S-transferase